MTLIPVILSGGAGTRLWPVSRELHPKPFIRLPDGESLLQKAFLRALGLEGVVEIMTVTNRDLYFKTLDEYGQVNQAKLPTSFLLEPMGRNTAPAIALAALLVAERFGPSAKLLILAADHLIGKQEDFQAAVTQAEQLAEREQLVTFGIQPSAPETGYGYIQSDGHRVKRFVEKPNLQKAQEYVASGEYLWNSGMFCFQAGALLSQLQIHAPDVFAAAKDCFIAAKRVSGEGLEQLSVPAESFIRAPDISIDYALMEKSDRVAVVACDIGWSDVGSWNAISEIEAPDAQGNRVVGDALLHDVKNCYIQSPQRLVGAVGVDNLIVIDTPDALLVADRNRAQDVKQIVQQLKAGGNEIYRVHKEVHRPWGTYTVLEEGAKFKIKRIVVRPGASLSLQMHHHRSEHWVVVSGMARVVNGDRDILVNTNESTFIPAGHQHRLQNPGILDLVMIEVQSGEYLGEDDIVRFEDSYGRC